MAKLPEVYGTDFYWQQKGELRYLTSRSTPTEKEILDIIPVIAPDDIKAHQTALKRSWAEIRTILLKGFIVGLDGILFATYDNPSLTSPEFMMKLSPHLERRHLIEVRGAGLRAHYGIDLIQFENIPEGAEGKKVLVLDRDLRKRLFYESKDSKTLKMKLDGTDFTKVPILDQPFAAVVRRYYDMYGIFNNFVSPWLVVHARIWGIVPIHDQLPPESRDVPFAQLPFYGRR